MPERFDISPILLRSQPGGSVSIESGGKSVEVSGDEGSEADKADRPKRPPVPPGWEILMVHGDEKISAIHGSAGEEAPDLGAWIEDHEEADKLKVYADAAALSRGDLAPLVKVAKRHRIDIDIQLRDDG